MEGLAYLVIFALAAALGFVGLVAAVCVGIWLPLPSWAYLAAFGIPAVVGGVGFVVWDRS